jgi:hypothetical protein
MNHTWTGIVQQLAERERSRNARARPYIGLAHLDCPTAKQEGSPIISTDTIKGCTNNCFRCYANRISRYHRKIFTQPMKCFVVGFPDANLVYRFGTFGDPATDWVWTFHELDRLKELGMKHFYLLTKLQRIEGFRDDPSLCLHVSFDPLNPNQLAITTQNFDTITAKKIVRVKSIRSGISSIMASQQAILDFAHQRSAAILETRFYTHVKRDLGLLSMHGYEKKGSLFKYPGSVLEDCLGHEDHLVCDRANTGKCRDCLNCLSLLT